MWGNAQGWVLSLILVVAMTAGLVYLSGSDQVTAQTSLTTDSRNTAPLQLPLPSIVAMGGVELSGDTSVDSATADFTSAIEAYLVDPSTYDRAANGSPSANFDQLPAIAPLLRAVAFNGNVPVVAPMATDVLTFKQERPPLDAIAALGKALESAAINNEADHPDIAKRYYSSEWMLGGKLFAERINYSELTTGTSMLTASAGRLMKLAGNNESVKSAYQSFEVARRDLQQGRLALLWPNVATIDPSVISMHAGDVFALARQCDERLWRVEACFALARFRFAALRPRDRAAAQHLLEKLATSEPDPIVKIAARNAQQMTVEDYRMLR